MLLIHQHIWRAQEFVWRLAPKFGGRDWLIATKQGAIVLWFERKMLLNSKSWGWRWGGFYLKLSVFFSAMLI